MISGTIKVVYMDTILIEMDYNSVAERNEFIDAWKLEFGIGFTALRFQIRPDII